MPFAEVIFETGSHSVVSYDNLDQLKSGLAEQHRRAVDGEQGGPVGHSAERVKRVLLYNEHPGDLNIGGLVDVDSLRNLIQGMETGGQVSAAQLTAAIRDEVSPLYPQDQGRHESLFKAQEAEELKLDFLSEGDS